MGGGRWRGDRRESPLLYACRQLSRLPCSVLAYHLPRLPPRAAHRIALTRRQQRVLPRRLMLLKKVAELDGRVARRPLARPGCGQAAAAGVHALARALLCASSRLCMGVVGGGKGIAGGWFLQGCSTLSDLLFKSQPQLSGGPPATTGWMHRFLRELRPRARMAGGSGPRYLAAMRVET